MGDIRGGQGTIGEGDNFVNIGIYFNVKQVLELDLEQMQDEASFLINK